MSPQAFATRARPANLKRVQLPGYSLSVEEIVLVSSMAHVNVAVFSHSGPLLRYAAGFFDGDGPVVCTELPSNNNQGRVRSHFERLISAEQVGRFSRLVMLEAPFDPGSLNTCGKKLAQKESNAVKAHGLEGPPG